jgi:hypothetical protein
MEMFLEVLFFRFVFSKSFFYAHVYMNPHRSEVLLEGDESVV